MIDLNACEVIGYNAIKALKKKLRTMGYKVNIPDLLVQANHSDPFYAGSPAQIRDAKWFASLWKALGWATKYFHIREGHYQTFSQKTPTKKPNGLLYKNTEQDWNYINGASRNARYLDMVDPLNFVDRRNPDPRLFHGEPSYNPKVSINDYGVNLHLPSINPYLSAHRLEIPTPQIRGYQYDIGDQEFHLELWIEKSTMEDELIPVCREFGVDYVPGVGNQSISNVLMLLLDRIEEIRKPTRVWYISDFDSSGDCMPNSVSRQLEFWRAKHNIDVDIKLIPLALTEEQCREYDLPRTFIKDTDKRKQKWEEKYGEGATELDALQALYPGELARLAREAFAPYRDETLEDRLDEAETEAIEAINEAWQELTKPEREELEKIHTEIESILKPFRQELGVLSQKLSEAMSPYQERVEPVQQSIEEKAEQLDEYLVDRPEAEIDLPDESHWLFDSDRSYLKQLYHYKKAQKKLVPWLTDLFTNSDTDTL